MSCHQVSSAPRGFGGLNSLSLLTYLCQAYHANPGAEVSGIELQRELGLDAAEVRACVTELARQGLVQWDPLLSNIWLRITDKGLAAARG
jgi:DNA-binding IclR family transcriptional regulator